tara:strand:- start:941 stop:1186 length:246 start_codon:yes stop_codon:yes gene_type:complete
MAKKDKSEEQVINLEGKEIKFHLEDLSPGAKAQYRRANQLAGELMQLDQAMNEKRFLVNNYVSFVVDELESNKNVDDKEEK